MERRHNNVAEGCSETDYKVACTMQNELKFQSTLKKSTFQKELVDIKGEFSWTCFGWISVDIFGDFFGQFFNSNEKSYTVIKQ